jgi:hypothetical protein
VQEFTVQTSVFSAEFGNTAGRCNQCDGQNPGSNNFTTGVATFGLTADPVTLHAMCPLFTIGTAPRDPITIFVTNQGFH